MYCLHFCRWHVLPFDWVTVIILLLVNKRRIHALCLIQLLLFINFYLIRSKGFVPFLVPKPWELMRSPCWFCRCFIKLHFKANFKLTICAFVEIVAVFYLRMLFFSVLPSIDISHSGTNWISDEAPLHVSADCPYLWHTGTWPPVARPALVSSCCQSSGLQPGFLEWLILING